MVEVEKTADELNTYEGKRITELKEEYKKWKKAMRWIGAAIIVVFLIISALNAHYIRATESTFKQLQDAINIVSAEVANSSGESRNITVEVNHANLLSADYLAGVIPVIIGLAGALLVFLGMERLKAFDERIDSTNSEIDKKLEGFDNKIEQNRSTLQKELTTEVERSVQSRFSQEQEKWAEQAEEVSTARKESIGELKKLKEELANTLDDEALDRLEKLDTKAKEYADGLESYAWLKAIIKEGETEISVPTVDAAHSLLERLRIQKPVGHIEMIRQIVAKVCNDMLSGESADYHNLSAELARGGMYLEACSVLERGLVAFPTDENLLSDLVEYATKGSMFEKAKEAVDKLHNTIPRRLWNWRCYEFICDYYKAIGDIEAAYQICCDFITAIPDDEHGYRSKAELERLMNPGQSGIELYISTLQSALDRNITCPQCANQLSETLLDNGRFEEALVAANRALRDLAQQQPHVNISYVFYNRANIIDRMVLQGTMTTEERQSMAENACEDYSMALSLGKLTVIVANQANARIQILSSYLSPEVKERIENRRKESREDSAAGLMQLLQNMVDNDN